ncbi:MULTISPECIES: ParB/RepB/Spo0J family partition protein [unclassified Paraburkholderia]|uniref:ParB/RepB/Spo0J family partition protein n=1 Tax=unclassified Paraburkholderia TaxID=2615204 RepID=UPI002AAFDBD2|nr:MULTISPECIES: ParB/RepB/Spo0J family partition protein [unclassified Paraburkholderia]
MGSNKLKQAFGRQRTVETVSEQTSGLSQLRETPSKFDHARRALAHASIAPVVAPVAASAVEPQLQVLTGDLSTASSEYRQWCEANAYRPGTNIEIPVGKLKSSRYNARHFYLSTQLQELIANIAEHKQQQPIHVTPDYDNPGYYFVTDGGRRWRALEALKSPHVIALVVDVPLGVQSYKLSYDLNVTKQDQTPFDDAIKWKGMLADGTFKSARELGEVLGIAEGQISKTLSLADLPEDLLELMVAIPAEEMGLRKAYEVGRYWAVSGNDEAATAKLIEHIANGDYAIKRVQAAIAGLKAASAGGKANSRPVFNRRVDFRLPSGESVGSLKTYGEDRLDLRVSGLPIDVRDRLQEAIQQALQRFVTSKPGSDEPDAQ